MEEKFIYVAKIKSLISCTFVSASYILVEETRKYWEDHSPWQGHHCHMPIVEFGPVHSGDMRVFDPAVSRPIRV